MQVNIQLLSYAYGEIWSVIWHKIVAIKGSQWDVLL